LMGFRSAKLSEGEVKAGAVLAQRCILSKYIIKCIICQETKRLLLSPV
jgi:hypothetical protein